MLKKHLVDFSIVIFIFLIDRVSKLLIISSPETYEQYGISITSFLNFNLIWNEGIAFGLFSFDEKLYYNLLTIFIILVTTVISWLMFKSKGFEKFCFIMILGGSFGNIFDRIFYSAVPDFIDIHFYNYHWFIFNVADIFITLGIISLISIEIFNSKNKKKMKVLKNILIISICSIFIYSCEGFKLKKKSTSGEEFLIQKKDPLILPPDFSKLPKPKDDIESVNEQEDSLALEKVFSEDKTDDEKDINNENSSGSDLKESILKKIK